LSVPYFKAQHERSGTLYAGRFKSRLGQGQKYLLAFPHYEVERFGGQLQHDRKQGPRPKTKPKPSPKEGLLRRPTYSRGSQNPICGVVPGTDICPIAENVMYSSYRQYSISVYLLFDYRPKYENPSKAYHWLFEKSG
jgi:hypothetical protein